MVNRSEMKTEACDSMGDRLRSRMASTDWPLAYLNVTAISIGVLVGVWHWVPESIGRYELIPVGLVVCMYAVTSALHYYEATREDPARAIAVVDEW